MTTTTSALLAVSAGKIATLTYQRETEVMRRDALIVRLRDEGITLNEIGRLASLSHTQVDNIVRRVKKSLQPTGHVHRSALRLQT